MIFSIVSFAGVAKPGLRRWSRKPLVHAPQGFKSLPQRIFLLIFFIIKIYYLTRTGKCLFTFINNILQIEIMSVKKNI